MAVKVAMRITFTLDHVVYKRFVARDPIFFLLRRMLCFFTAGDAFPPVTRGVFDDSGLDASEESWC
jgi:hypothetical protein